MVNYTENGGMSSPTLSSVTFGGNHANYGGGGMANMGVSGSGTARPTSPSAATKPQTAATAAACTTTATEAAA